MSMRELTLVEIGFVSWEKYETEIAAYILAVYGIAVGISMGPIGWAVAFANWALAAHSTNKCTGGG